MKWKQSELLGRKSIHVLLGKAVLLLLLRCLTFLCERLIIHRKLSVPRWPVKSVQTLMKPSPIPQKGYHQMGKKNKEASKQTTPPKKTPKQTNRKMD